MNFNYELILFYITLGCGLIALADILFFARKRQKNKKMRDLASRAPPLRPLLYRSDPPAIPEKVSQSRTVFCDGQRFSGDIQEMAFVAGDIKIEHPGHRKAQRGSGSNK